MTLMTRITRLFKADLHGILDDLEDPQEVVKQARRDMEEDIAQQEQRLGQLEAVQERLEREAQELAETLAGIERQIALCFIADNELLARKLIRKRLETAHRGRSVARAQAETRAQYETLARNLALHRQQLAVVIQQLACLGDRRQDRSGTVAGAPACQSGHVVTDDEVEVAFLEEKQRRMSHATSDPA